MNWEKIILYVCSGMFLILSIGFFVLNRELNFELLAGGHSMKLEVSNTLVCAFFALVTFIAAHKLNGK